MTMQVSLTMLALTENASVNEIEPFWLCLYFRNTQEGMLFEIEKKTRPLTSSTIGDKCGLVFAVKAPWCYSPSLGRRWITAFGRSSLAADEAVGYR